MKKIGIFLLFFAIFCGIGSMLFPEAKMCHAVSETTPADTVPSRNYTVVIDPGHGGTDVKKGQYIITK